MMINGQDENPSYLDPNDNFHINLDYCKDASFTSNDSNSSKPVLKREKSTFAKIATRIKKKDELLDYEGSVLPKNNKLKFQGIDLKNIDIDKIDPAMFSDYMDRLPEGASTSLYNQLVNLALSPTTIKKKQYIPSNFYEEDEKRLSSL